MHSEKGEGEGEQLREKVSFTLRAKYVWLCMRVRERMLVAYFHAHDPTKIWRRRDLHNNNKNNNVLTSEFWARAFLRWDVGFTPTWVSCLPPAGHDKIKLTRHRCCCCCCCCEDICIWEQSSNNNDLVPKTNHHHLSLFLSFSWKSHNLCSPLLPFTPTKDRRRWENGCERESVCVTTCRAHYHNSSCYAIHFFIFIWLENHLHTHLHTHTITHTFIKNHSAPHWDVLHEK